MFRRIAKGIVSALLLTGMLFPMACGSDDDDGGAQSATENSCFWDCGDGLPVCTSNVGLTQAQCESEAESDCGAAPAQIALQAGCGCPGFDEPGECTNPPSWAQ
jgi:hypothetical protein